VPDDLGGFIHRVEVRVDGEDWYLLGPELELLDLQMGQAQDIPGHCWVKSPPLYPGGPDRLLGKHYNTGPIGAGRPPRFWSSDAGDDAQLYWVDTVIDIWSPSVAAERQELGYVHYHELVRPGDGCVHPTKVLWFRHHALKSFTFDGGPPLTRPDGTPFRTRNIPHEVDPGIDFAFPPNYDIEYRPDDPCSFTSDDEEDDAEYDEERGDPAGYESFDED